MTFPFGIVDDHEPLFVPLHPQGNRQKGERAYVVLFDSAGSSVFNLARINGGFWYRRSGVAFGIGAPSGDVAEDVFEEHQDRKRVSCTD